MNFDQQNYIVIQTEADVKKLLARLKKHSATGKHFFIADNNLIDDSIIRCFSMADTLILRGPSKVTDLGLMYLCNVRKLDISLLDNITDGGIAYLDCEEITIADCSQLSPEAYKYLSDKKRIELYNCNINDDSLKELSDVYAVKLVDCADVTDNGVGCLRNSKIVSILNCLRVEGGCIERLIDSGVKSIEYSRCIVQETNL